MCVCVVRNAYYEIDLQLSYKSMGNLCSIWWFWKSVVMNHYVLFLRMNQSWIDLHYSFLFTEECLSSVIFQFPLIIIINYSPPVTIHKLSLLYRFPYLTLCMVIV